MHAPETSFLLALTALPLLAGLFFLQRRQEKAALTALLLGALALRLVMIALDPYLHEWDERYHALVAKNLMNAPFKPMLRVHPVLPYEAGDWCCNHVWLHKQPLFLWQMALSMKLFGIGTFALRLPDVAMGVAIVYLVFRTTRIWLHDFRTAWLAAFLYAVSNFQLELTSGRLATDHNDVAFAFYVTAGIWALAEYTRRPSAGRAVLIGVFVGAAVLVKWLTALIVFVGWALYAGWNAVRRGQRWPVGHALVALGVCAAVSVPWQVYVHRAFPMESAVEQAHNRAHFTDAFSQPGSWWFHLEQLPVMYGWLAVPLLVWGVVLLARRRTNPPWSLAMLGMTVGLYVFFMFVATKMKAYVLPMAVVVWALVALGLAGVLARLERRGWRGVAWALLIIVGVATLRPWEIARARSATNAGREIKLHNATIYRRLAASVPADRLIFNCKSLDDVDVMFWTPNTAYHWFPAEADIRALQARGYRLAAFDSHTNQGLPDYLGKDTTVLVLHEAVR